MNKLREKIENILPSYTNRHIVRLVQVTDDFSDRFAEWLDDNATQKAKSLWYGISLGIEPKNPITTAELRQHFKNKIYGK